MRVGGGRHPARSRPRRTVNGKTLNGPRRSRESLGRRRRRWERPIPSGHPTTTRVSELLFTGAIGKVMQGRAREGSSCARWDRSPRRRELHRCDAGSRATGGSSRGSLVRPSGRPAARAMLETASPHRPSIRAPRGERDPRSVRRAGTSAGIGARGCASRVDDTAESLFAFSRRFALTPKRGAGEQGEARGPGRRTARNAEGERRCLGPYRSQEPFTRLGGGGLGSRVRPEVAETRDRGPTPVDVAPPGKPAERRGIRGTPADGNRRRQRSGPLDGSPK